MALMSLNGSEKNDVYGVVSDVTVKFAYTENLLRIASSIDGQFVFYADKTGKTGILTLGGEIVSSKIQDVSWAAVSGGVSGENTITVKYIGYSGSPAVPTSQTATLTVVDKNAAKSIVESYFTSSNTIGVTNGTANVRVDSSTLLIDSTSNYLKSGLRIAYVSAGQKIQLQDAHGAMLSEIPVSSISGGGLPDVTVSDNGKTLMVVNGAWALVQPSALYSGSGLPNNTYGSNGDLYVQTD